MPLSSSIACSTRSNSLNLAKPFGAIAQLGERVVRNDEVGSSILPGSTKIQRPTVFSWAFSFVDFARHAGLQPLYINHLCACRYETRNATLDLRRIHPRAYRGWGDIVAGRAPVDPYAMITFAATHPQKVRLRQYNSASF